MLLPLLVMMILLVMRLLILLLLVGILAPSSSSAIPWRIASSMLRCVLWGHRGRASCQIDIDPSGVMLGGILETQFLAYLLDSRFYTLDVVG